MTKKLKMVEQEQERVPGLFSLATAGALTTVILWGGSSMATKLGTGTIDGSTLGILRVIAAGPCALLVIIAMGLRLPWYPGCRIYFSIITLVGMALAPIIFTLGVELTTAGHAVVASSSTAIFAGLIEAIALRKWPQLRWWIGTLVAFVGALILISESLGLSNSDATWQGDLLCLLGAFFGSIAFYLGSRLSVQYGATSITLWSVFFASIFLLPVLLVTETSTSLLKLNIMNWAVVFYLAAGASVLATTTWYYALSRGGIGRMAVWQFTLPIVGIVLATIVLDEKITVALIASVVVILFGIALVQHR
jgi:DME family drug/metabolite transporter